MVKIILALALALVFSFGYAEANASECDWYADYYTDDSGNVYEQYYLVCQCQSET